MLEYYKKNGIEPDDVPAVRQALDKIGGKEYATMMAMDYYSRCINALDESGLDSQALQDLKDVASLVVERDY